jgi:hypothetical protein
MKELKIKALNEYDELFNIEQLLVSKPLINMASTENGEVFNDSQVLNQ